MNAAPSQATQHGSPIEALGFGVYASVLAVLLYLPHNIDNLRVDVLIVLTFFCAMFYWWRLALRGAVRAPMACLIGMLVPCTLGLIALLSLVAVVLFDSGEHFLRALAITLFYGSISLITFTTPFAAIGAGAGWIYWRLVVPRRRRASKD